MKQQWTDEEQHEFTPRSRLGLRVQRTSEIVQFTSETDIRCGGDQSECRAKNVS